MRIEIEVADEVYDQILKNELSTQIEFCDDETVKLACSVLWNFYGFGDKSDGHINSES